MATINQINKQIETSRKRIADYDRKIAMYTERRDKNIEKANKKYNVNITLDDIVITFHGNNTHTYKDYSLKPEAYNAIGFDMSFKIINAVEYIDQNERHKAYEEKNLNRLLSEFNSLQEKEKEERDRYDNKLESVLRDNLGEFKEVWMERMMNQFRRHYDFIKERTPEEKHKVGRIDSLLYYFRGKMLYYPKTYRHSRLINILEYKKKTSNNIINDEVNRYDDKETYLQEMEKELEKSWEQGIKKLTKKCHSYNVDQEKVTCNHCKMTDKGIEVYIQDGKPRRIYARVIWAAEYSDIVTPHTRYIVTEKKLTKNLDNSK